MLVPTGSQDSICRDSTYNGISSTVPYCNNKQPNKQPEQIREKSVYGIVPYLVRCNSKTKIPRQSG